MRKSLDDILDDNEPEEQPEQAEQPEQQPPEKEEVEKGVEPEPEQAEENAEPPSDQLPKDVYAPLKAVRDENKGLKEQLERLNQQLQEQAKPKEPEKPAPSMWEDDQAWQQHFGGQLVNQATTTAAYQSKLNTSEFYARKNIEGFDDSWDELNGWLSSNPAIAQQASQDYDPWGFAWRQFNNQKTMQELQATDVNDLRTKLRDEIMAELQAQPAPNVPKSLSSKRSVGSRSGPAWSGPKSLDDILG